MNYLDFVKACEKLLSRCTTNKLLIPNLGGQSLFLFYLENDKVKIVNSKEKFYIFEECEFNAIRDRFSNSDNFYRFKICNYTRTTCNAACKGWRRENGNSNEIYWGYLPAIFREVYKRASIAVCDETKYTQNSDFLSYIQTDWDKYSLSILNSFFENSFEDFKAELAVKQKKLAANFTSGDYNKLIALLKTDYTKRQSDLIFLLNLWDAALSIFANVITDTLAILIADLLKDLVKKQWRKWHTENTKCKFPRRDCTTCPRNKKIFTTT